MIQESVPSRLIFNSGDFDVFKRSFVILWKEPIPLNFFNEWTSSVVQWVLNRVGIPCGRCFVECPNRFRQSVVRYDYSPRVGCKGFSPHWFSNYCLLSQRQLPIRLYLYLLPFSNNVVYSAFLNRPYYTYPDGTWYFFILKLVFVGIMFIQILQVKKNNCKTI